MSPSFTRPRIIRHLLFSTPDSYSSSILHPHPYHQAHQHLNHQRSSHHPSCPPLNSSNSQPSPSIHSLSHSSLTHHHQSNPTLPLRIGLPIISIALAHQSNHPDPYRHHHRSHSYLHRHLNQVVAVASRTEIRILQVINQQHPLPPEHSHHLYPLNLVQSQATSTITDSQPSSSGRSIESTTSINDRLTIKLNSELGPSYGTSDLSWGYASTALHLTIGCTNGSISLWDINHPTSPDPAHHKRLLTLDHVHSRAINKITFAGPTGHWIASGAQDSLIKIWDIRESSRPTMILTTHSDPIRQLRFFPDRTANPFDLFVLTDSGTLSHFDLRQQKSCLARRVAHASTGVGLDWFSDGRASLLASAGADGIVKIWNMAESILPTTAMRTLVVGRSVRGMAWRPGHATQLVITPSSAMADLNTVVGQQSYSDCDRTPSSTISSTYPDDLMLSKGLNITHTSSASDTFSESYSVGDGRHSEILLWDIRRLHVPESIIRGRDGPASGMVWLSPNLLLSAHKRTSAIVQHDLGQYQSKYAEELPSQALAVSHKGSLCFAIGGNQHDCSNMEEELESVMVHSLDTLKSPKTFEFLALNYKFEGRTFEQVCDHNADLCRQAGLAQFWQLWHAVKLWFSPQVSATLLAAQEMVLDSDGNGERAVALAMRRVLKEESSDEGEVELNQSSLDFESTAGGRSPSQDRKLRQDSTTTANRATLSEMRDNKEDLNDRCETHSPAPNLDRSIENRSKLSLSSLAPPSGFETAELLRGGQSLNRSSSTTTPKVQVRSSFCSHTAHSNNHLEASIEAVRRRPAPLRSLVIDCDSPLSSPDTEGPRRLAAHRRTERTPEGHLNPTWRRSMSKDRIAAKMHARGASFNELGSLIQAIGVKKILSEKREDRQNQDERQSVEIQMRESILEVVKKEVEVNGNVQLGVYILGILKVFHQAQDHFQSHDDEGNPSNVNSVAAPQVLGIAKEILDDHFKRWLRAYIQSLRRNPSLLVIISEIKKRFTECNSSKEVEDQSLRILKLNPSCGNCGKVLINSVLPTHQLSSINSNHPSLTTMMINNHKKKILLNSHSNFHNVNAINNINLKCDKCQSNVLRCCFCHELIKYEPLIICLKCGHGAHSSCLKRTYDVKRSNPSSSHPSSSKVERFTKRSSTSGPQPSLQDDLHPNEDYPLEPDRKDLEGNEKARLDQVLKDDLSSFNRLFLQCPSGCGCVGCFYSC